MSKYFIDNEIYYKGERLPPRRVLLTYVEENEDRKTTYCIGEDENVYILNLNEILEDNKN